MHTYNVVKVTGDLWKWSNWEKNNAFKNSALFRSGISKINSTLIDNAEDLDQNYSKTSRSLWNYCTDQIDNINDNASDGKSFIYSTKIVRKTPAPPGNEGAANLPEVPTLNVKVTKSLKYLNNFSRFLDLPMINCETELDLSWKKYFVLIE